MKGRRLKLVAQNFCLFKFAKLEQLYYKLLQMPLLSVVVQQDPN